MDTVDARTRSKIMSSVGQKNTGPELLIRSALHRLGLRYRLHDRSLPGSPDLVFPKFGAAVFVHGCYWHRHGCYRSTTPKSSEKFWCEKFDANKARDRRNVAALRKSGWRVLIVWECAVKGKTALSVSDVALCAKLWLGGSQALGEIAGREFAKTKLKSEKLCGLDKPDSASRSRYVDR